MAQIQYFSRTCAHGIGILLTDGTYVHVARGQRLDYDLPPEGAVCDITDPWANLRLWRLQQNTWIDTGTQGCVQSARSGTAVWCNRTEPVSPTLQWFPLAFNPNSPIEGAAPDIAPVVDPSPPSPPVRPPKRTPPPPAVYLPPLQEEHRPDLMAIDFVQPTLF